MSFEHWVLFASTEFVAYLVPGPAVLLVTSRALVDGAREATRAAIGILLAEVMFFMISATGIGILLSRTHAFFLVVKWAGAAYLVWLGVQALRGRDDLSRLEHGAEPARGALHGVSRGFITNCANPKALLFYVAILPQFIDPAGPIGAQFAILGVTSICAGGVVFALYTIAAELMAAKLRTPRFARYTGAGSGVLFICAGAGLALIDTD